MNILIVDDQTWILSGMLTGIHWRELGIEHVYTVGSAEEARKIFQNVEVHILITDIEMPYENGISLVRWVRERGYEAECIFLTSHAEFDYAREAVSLESFDYILQPARYETIEAVIRRVYTKVIKKKNTQRLQNMKDYEEQLTDDTADHYLEKLILEQERAETALGAILRLKDADGYQDPVVVLTMHQILRWKGKKWEHNLARASVLNVLQELIDSEKRKVIRLKLKKDIYVVFVVGEREVCKTLELRPKLEQYLDFEQDYLDFDSAFYYFGEAKPEELAACIRKTEEEISRNIMSESKVFVCGGQEEESQKSFDRSSLFRIGQWEEMLLSGKGERIIQELQAYFEENKFCHGNTVENTVLLKKLHQGFASALYYVMTVQHMDYGNLFDENYSLQDFMNSYDTYEHLIQAVKYVVEHLEKAETEKDTFSEDSQINQMVTYVRNNLDKKITYKDMAEVVHLNEDYLSRLFKKKTGYTLKEYINRERIRLAKELLSETRMSVSVIALKTGFENFSHFSQVFRKTEGVSPSEYRSRNTK